MLVYFFNVFNVVKEVYQLYTDHCLHRKWLQHNRSVWLLLANAMFITVIAVQASETYFRVITLILFLSAQMESVSILYTTHKLIFPAKRNAVSHGRVVINSIIVSF